MPVYYDDPDFTVRQALIGPWRVDDKRRGVTVAPAMELREKIGFMWKRLRSDLKGEPDLRRTAEDRMFRIFAEASADMRSEAAGMFRVFNEADLARIIVETIVAERDLRVAALRSPPDDFR